MRVHALLSWWMEKPDHLTEMMASVAPLVDSIIAVDGVYSLYLSAVHRSTAEEYKALGDACDEHGLALTIHRPAKPWAGNEVEKRSALFALANGVATPHEDWFLIMDGDMTLDAGVDVPTARELLAATDRHVAEVTFAELVYGASPTHGDTISASRFRSLFRAIPGLTVEGTHWLYKIPDLDGAPAWPWHAPWDGIDPLPALDLTGEICLLHRPHGRDHERTRGRLAYYEKREARRAEKVPPRA